MLPEIEKYKRRIAELEEKLTISEDLISIFDSTGTSKDGHFGANSVNALELSMFGPSDSGIKKDHDKSRLKPRELPVFIEPNAEANKLLIISLVKVFFDRAKPNYFRDLFDEPTILQYIEKASKKQGIEDGEMMVLLAILIDRCKNCLLYKKSAWFDGQSAKLKVMVGYYFQISKSQETESLNFIKSQILMINFFYYQSHVEKAWKMLSQTVSNAYAHGLHLSQGPTWMKLSLMEALICELCSRPNLIQGLRRHMITQEEDPFREYEFIYTLRDRNMLYIDAVLNKQEVRYNEMLQLDMRFDSYSSYLQGLQRSGNVMNSVSKVQRCWLLLLLNVNCHIKLHSEYFDRDRFSDVKLMRLIPYYLDVLEKMYGRSMIHSMRDDFSPLECSLYQFTLIFIKFLNFKAVRELLTPRLPNGQASEDMLVLEMCQQRLVRLVESDRDYFNNDVMGMTIPVIKALNLLQLKSENFIRDPTGNHFYASNQLKTILEDRTLLDSLRDVSQVMSRNVLE
jgi:hypothetical protein